MRCSKCGAENLDRAKFCEECGSPFARRCPSCDAENSPTAKFCIECASLLAYKPPSSAWKPNWSRWNWELQPAVHRWASQ
jgi:ribosomal protein L40E